MRRLAGPAHQREMSADVERRRFACQFHGVLEGGAVRHQRGCRKDAGAVRLDNAAVHVKRETEIVRVNNETSGGAQKSPSLMRRNFFGLARKSFMNALISCVAPFSDS